LIVNYERGESGGELFSDKGFIHARITRDLTDHWIVETFTQKEFNKLISLNDRQLFGGGMRYEIRAMDTSRSQTHKYSVGLGSGFMYERESTSDPRDKKVLIRSTSYLSVRWQLDERVTFLSTAYLQLAVRKRSDFRVLDESSLSFAINKTLSFLTSFNLRYDNEPPPTVKNYDITVTNGINVRF
jgi:putative salt-induced outer membrane protein YdiY